MRLKKSSAAAPRRNGKLAKSASVSGFRDDSPESRSRLILAAIEAFRDGDFTVRLPTTWSQVEAQIATAFNQTIAQKQRISKEVTRLSETVGKEGRLRQRMSLPGAIGDWATEAESINTLIDDLVRPTTEIARTIGSRFLPTFIVRPALSK